MKHRLLSFFVLFTLLVTATPVFTTSSDGTEVESTMDDAGDAPFDIYVYDTIMDIFTPGGEWDPASFMRSIFVDTVQSFVGMIDGNEERIGERVDNDKTIIESRLQFYGNEGMFTEVLLKDPDDEKKGYIDTVKAFIGERK